MKRFKNILLVADGKPEEKEAFDQAVGLAKSNQARLTVVGILEKIPPEIGMAITAVPLDKLQKIAMEERFKQLQGLIASVEDKSIQIHARVFAGMPFLQIINEVLRNQHDLVMKTAEGVGQFKQTLFGSTDLHLIRKCPCPVWIVKPSRQKRYPRILAAVDPDPYDEVRNGLNLVIMDLATSLARSEQSELHVVHAWALYNEAIFRSEGVQISGQEVNELVRKTRELHKKWFDELLEKHALDDPKDQAYLLKGKAGEVIPALAHEKQVELIVMGTAGRTGLKGFLIGHTTENILHQVNCSVLTIKPKEFVSPVKLEKEFVDDDHFEEELFARDEEELKETFLQKEQFILLRLRAHSKSAPLIGHTLKDLQLPEEILIALIRRKGQIIIPHGHTMLQEGDPLSIVGDSRGIQQFCEQYEEKEIR